MAIVSIERVSAVHVSDNGNKFILEREDGTFEVMEPGGEEGTALTPSRSRWLLSEDFEPLPVDELAIVPWDTEDFVDGDAADDYTLELDGKILVNNHVYANVYMSADWKATSSPEDDIALRQIGLRIQRDGEGDEDQHTRIAAFNTPSFQVPDLARYSGTWDPPSIGAGARESTTVTLTPAGVIPIGAVAFAGHSQIKDSAITQAAVDGLIVSAKVIAADEVRVTINNLTASAIDIPSGNLRVLALHAVTNQRGSSDSFQSIASPLLELFPGDKIYSEAQMKIAGTLLQADQAGLTWIQIDTLIRVED